MMLFAKEAHQNWFCLIPVSCLRNNNYFTFVRMQLLMKFPMQKYKEIRTHTSNHAENQTNPAEWSSLALLCVPRLNRALLAQGLQKNLNPEPAAAHITCPCISRKLFKHNKPSYFFPSHGFKHLVLLFSACTLFSLIHTEHDQPSHFFSMWWGYSLLYPLISIESNLGKRDFGWTEPTQVGFSS